MKISRPQRFRYFPEAIRVLDTYPSVADVEAAFATAGFTTVGFEQVPQVTAGSLRDAATTLCRESSPSDGRSNPNSNE